MSDFWDSQVREERGNAGWPEWLGYLVIRTRQDWVKHWYKTIDAYERDSYFPRQYLPSRDDPPPEHIANFDVVDFDEKDLIVVFETGSGNCLGGYADSIQNVQRSNGIIAVDFSSEKLDPTCEISSDGGDSCHMIQIDKTSHPITFRDIAVP